MNGLIDTEAWDDIPQEKAIKDQEDREAALPGETENIWAIEGSSGPNSRQRLPSWLAKPVEDGLMQWSEQRRKWDTILLQKNGSLSGKQKAKYEEWKETQQELKLLFNKKKKKQVTKLRANASMKTILQEMLTVVVVFNDDPEQITIQAGTNPKWKLLLLEGEGAPVEQSPACPFIENAGVDAVMIPGFQQEQGENIDDAEDDDPAMQELDVMLEQDLHAGGDGTEDMLEVMAQSSDEEACLVVHAGGSAVKKVKAFHHREEYQFLEELGLAMIPVHVPGVYLTFHKTSNSWQGFFPECHSGLSYSFGGTTGSVWAAF